MKTITVRLPEALAAAIEAESRERGVSKSDVIREQLERIATAPLKPPAPPPSIADLIGSVDGLPSDLSAHKERYLQAKSYGRKHHR